MSRCFPYPPPGYHRNGATYEALIESIKLQKKTDKTKAERKQEKKAKKEAKKELKEKKPKEKRNSDDSDKVLQKVAEPQIKKPEPTTEVFEKSDLTQEHGQPISPHQPSYSSDSTQNSNKRKRDEAPLLPGSFAGHGKPFKIRLLKKQKGPDSNTGRIPVPCTGLNAVPAKTSQTDSDPCFAKPNLTSERQAVSGIRLEHEVPSSSGKTYNEQGIYSGKPLQLVLNHDGKRYLSQTKAQPYNGGNASDLIKTEDPSKVGPTRVEEKTEDLPKVGLTRAEKKRQKKHAKYEKLLGSWLPPAVETRAHLLGGDDDDWLRSGVKTANRSISWSEEVEACRDTAVGWQPCERFLADVDIHVMPYTVPF